MYAYCFEVLLSAVASWGSIFAMAVLTNTLWATVCDRKFFAKVHKAYLFYRISAK